MLFYTYKTIKTGKAVRPYALVGFDFCETCANGGIFEDRDPDSICIRKPGTYCVMYSLIIQTDGCVSLYLNGGQVQGSRKNGVERLEGQAYIFLETPGITHITIKNCGRKDIQINKGCLVVFAV